MSFGISSVMGVLSNWSEVRVPINGINGLCYSPSSVVIDLSVLSVPVLLVQFNYFRASSFSYSLVSAPLTLIHSLIGKLVLSPSGVDNDLGYLYPLLVFRCLFFRMANFLPEFSGPMVPLYYQLIILFFQDFFFCTSCLYNGEAEKTLAIIWFSILLFLVLEY